MEIKSTIETGKLIGKHFQSYSIHARNWHYNSKGVLKLQILHKSYKDSIKRDLDYSFMTIFVNEHKMIPTSFNPNENIIC